MAERLNKYPRNGEPRTYMTVHRGAGGWNSGVWGWTELDNGETMADGSTGFYEPIQTGFTNTSLGSGSREDALAEAEGWAVDEDIPLWIPPPEGCLMVWDGERT